MCLPQKVEQPDRIEAEGVHAGHEWAIFVHPMGFRCGYVKVTSEHPWHGVDFDELGDVEVHGGLACSFPDVPCHAPGEDDGWWFGFDAGHGYDRLDPELADEAYRALYVKFDAYGELPGEIRSREYMAGECRRLAEQAARARASIPTAEAPAAQRQATR